MIAHPSEHITKMMATADGIKLPGEWSHSPECDATKIRSHEVPKNAVSRASTRAALLCIDLAVSMPVTSLRAEQIRHDFCGRPQPVQGDQFLEEQGLHDGCAAELRR